ncbi:MAG: hypothetical protein LBC41_05850, partial [Clostridiales bacterium]|nr:hypothetical protein [Clostridiales bacterium]
RLLSSFPCFQPHIGQLRRGWTAIADLCISQKSWDMLVLSERQIRISSASGCMDRQTGNGFWI